MDITIFIQNWLALSNAYDTNNYLKKWHNDAILDDPSVGQKFVGHNGIKKYFEDYFIGYKTQTRLINLVVITKNTATIEVEFTGDFPGGVIGGTFDFEFKDDLIFFAKADLI